MPFKPLVKHMLNLIAPPPPHGMTLFLHNSFAVTIGMAGLDGMGCFLSPSMAHLLGLNEGTRREREGHYYQSQVIESFCVFLRGTTMRMPPPPSLCPFALRLFNLALSRGERAGPVCRLKREGEEVIAAPRGPARLIPPEPAAPQRGGCGGGEVESGGVCASYISHAAVDVKSHRALSLRVLPPRVKHTLNLHQS